ncbi:MAG: hypothetical protein QOC59_919 [Microbacteriaceae bacterium]|jgi:hypothetical protein|nr:hypothetical protein [Microbacteriaceae bacterium]
MNRHSWRPLAIVAVVAALFAVLPVAPASAAGATGWVRLAHLSPDTKQVDVTLTSLSGGTMVLHLTKVGYGDVSPYIRLPVGTYAIAMVPTGAPADSTPFVSASVAVTQGRAETVAAMNLNKSIETHVFRDDLTAPASDSARVRVIQASTKHQDVAVKDGSTTVSDSVTFPSASGYADVPAGTASLAVSAGSTTAEQSVRLAGGSVHTLFVLDTAAGGLTVSPVLDSASAAIMPSGAVETGAGGLAGPGGASSSMLAAVLAALAAAGAATAGVRLARRPAGAPAKP